MVKHEDERAFPVSVDMGNGRSATNLGMTLRDYFAAKAMQPVIGYLIENGGAENPEDAAAIAKISYTMADAMLAERAK